MAPLYISRSADTALFEAAKNWFKSDRHSGWISVRSRPGRGNTALLKRFQQLTSVDDYALKDLCRIFVDGSLASSDREPPILPPVAQAVYERYNKTWSARLATLARRAARFAHVIAILLVAWMLIVTKLQSEKSEHGLLTISFWREVGASLFHRPLEDAGILIVSVIAELTIAYLIHRVEGFAVAHHRRKESEQQNKPEFAEIGNYGEKFFHMLESVQQGTRGLLVIADRAGELPKNDRILLENLARGGESRVGHFARKHRILIITLDFEEDDWRSGNIGEDTVRVDAFTESDLRAMYLARYPDRGQDGFAQVRERAENSIHFLFATPVASQKIVEKYIEAEDEGTAGAPGVEGVFGKRETLAYWAARNTPSITKAELRKWLHDLSRPALRALNLAPPEGQLEEMVSYMADSQLFRTHRQFLYFDEEAVATLRSFLLVRERMTIARAHYYWAATLSPEVFNADAAELPAVTERTARAVRRAGWHASQIGEIVRDGDASQKAFHILSDAAITEAEEVSCRVSVAKVLVVAAEASASDGELEEAARRIDDALEWLAAIDYPAVSSLLKRAVSALWSHYLLSGSDSAPQLLKHVAAQWPPAAQEPVWLVNAAYADALKARVPALPPVSEPELANIRALTSWEVDIRQSHGFPEDALADPSVTVPGPVPAGGHWAEQMLWEYKAAAANLRADIDELQHTMRAWREILGTEPASAPLDAQLMRTCHLARYYRTVCDFWRWRRDQINELPQDAQHEAKEELRRLCRTLAPQPISPGTKVSEAIFMQAESLYARALQSASQLGWQMLVLSLSFETALLLLRHTLRAERKKLDWWLVWRDLFNRALALEAELGLKMYAPQIYRLRLFFFEGEDRPTAVGDMYNTFQAVQACGYGNKIILEWHSRAQAFLNNDGSTAEHFKWTAELHDTWAEELAELAETEGVRSFRYLPFEQAFSLIFSAQALRRARDWDAAELRLRRAQELVLSVPAELASVPVNPKQKRELLTAIRMQEAWLSGDREQDAADEANHHGWHAMISDAWREVEPGDVHNANLIGNLIRIEHAQHLLHQAWPEPDNPPYLDPLNARMSLPAEWFGHPAELQLANRFDFRLHQLLQTVTLRAHPTFWELIQAASRDWSDQERFGQTALEISALAVQEGYLPNERALLMDLVRALTEYFSRAIARDELELQCLHLLIEMAPDQAAFRERYFDVLSKHIELLRDYAASQTSANFDWLYLARKTEHLFGILANPDLRNADLAREVQRRGQSRDQFLEQRKQLDAALTQARARFTRQDFAAVVNLLGPYLPTANPRFVTFHELEALDLWVKAARMSGADEYQSGMRTAQLRDLARLYVGQFVHTISDKRVQHLVLQLLDALGA